MTIPFRFHLRGAARPWALSLLLLASMLAPANAAADSGQITIFDPPGSTLIFRSHQQRTQVLDQIQASGADAVRVGIPWRNFAPDPNSARPPPGFDASDPADYPQDTMNQLDDLVTGITQRGMTVMLNPGGPVPDWASASGTSDLNRPTPDAFRQFVTALGVRYGGHCTPPLCIGSDPLPRVDFWSIWNEPNLYLFLRPQHVNGRRTAGAIYRHLFLAAQQGLEDSGHEGDPVLIGETAPSRGTQGTRPVAFLRDVFCLDSHYRLKPSCEPIEAAGWGEHPYSPGVPPWVAPRPKGYISIGSLFRLERALRKAWEAGATVDRIPVYVTEFGVESYPEPASRYGVSPQQQAEYMGISEYLLYRDPQVRSYAQYLLTDDDQPKSYLSFQTGLRYANGSAKPSYDSFPMTLVAQAQGTSVRLWGHVRPASGSQLVQLSYKDPGGFQGHLITVATDSDGYFDLTTTDVAGRQWQATCQLPDGRLLQGTWIRSYRFN